MIEVSTSILSVKKEQATKTFYNLEVAKTNYFHIDVMDGKFVPNNTAKLMKEYATTIKHISNLPLDVHLMVENPKEYILEYLELQPNIITIHKESIKQEQELIELINLIKENNIKAGISVKPNTPIEEIYNLLPYIHVVLIMTVEPGKGGQKLIPETIEKIRKLNEYLQQKNLEIDIEVDGGINTQNVEQIKNAGANIIVAGTAIINSENYEQTIKELKE